MIRIGTSGYSFADWKGTIYPDRIKQADILGYYSSTLAFDTVEINSSYYAPLSRKAVEGMAARTGKDFIFVFKAYRGLTHDPFDPRLADRPDPVEAAEKAKLFASNLAPLSETNRLGGVLLQFPVFFRPSPETTAHILRCAEAFRGIETVVEFRNSEWMTDETFNLLRSSGLGYCAVDEPPLEGLVPFRPETTSAVGYFRLHGRSRKWFNATLAERYDYLYSKEELSAFKPAITKMEKQTKVTFVMFNNCHAGSAVKNAMMMKEILSS